MFLVSSVGKISGRDAFSAFVDSVTKLEVVASRHARRTAYLVVTAEVAAFLLLALPFTITGVAGFAVSIVLLVAFAVSILVALRRGVRARCRCFGTAQALLGREHAARDLGVAALAALGAVATLADGSLHWGGVAVAVFTGVISGGLITVLDDILGLFRDGTSRSSRTSRNSPSIGETDAVSDRGRRVHRTAVPPGSDPHIGRDQAPA
ncbi:MauE/DoxX family redox-associated membrane protein [Sphaerisporangium krabiense]|uniref:MauE/DoxX family redox-associated membrane protein n=1 Tax=Sphaerisporangium krabiense TaxID=763782 RepID=UPI003555F3D4